ncbi:MAG: helix-turn-helix transcriptional regulator [Kofleriaceae bacterium]|nr:helix-turn-helix transcriptional regulator [Kofleriaceae bacterium]
MEPIGARIEARLAELAQNPAWLADKAGVSRSTITRILKGDRNPTPQTLQEIAPVLGVTLEQLVAGTNAAERVGEAQQLVSRRDFEAAVAQVIEFERKANDLAASVRDLKEEIKAERERTTKARRDAENARRDLEAAETERDRARRDARRYEDDAKRYQHALEKAVTDVAQLRATVHELTGKVTSGNVTTKIGAALAGVAAVVSVAHYLRNADDQDEVVDEDDLDEVVEDS